MTMEFNFILSNNSAKGFLSNSESENESTLLTNYNTPSEISNLLSNMTSDEACLDAFGGKDLFGTCDVSSMSEFNFVATDSSETAGSVAYNAGTETMGSVAFAGGGAETAGSVACSSGSSDGGGCSCGGFSSFC